MATTFSWRVKSVKSDPNDDEFIKEVGVEIYGTEGSVTKMETQSCIFTGNKAAVGSDFKAYSTLIGSDKAFTATGENTIVGWVKDIFMDYKVTKIQNRIQAQIDTHNEKVLETEVEPTSSVAKPEVTVTPDPTE
tara:strand:- start:282 stop:683 length:402 start_codon:yes stop_codon:yes gene_type:complete